MHIACLHTAESNVAVFEAAGRNLDFVAGTLLHTVRADLLADAEQAGGLTPDIEVRTGQVLLALCEGADVVLLTCSTLWPAARTMARTAPIPVMRVDAALAAETVRGGGKVVVLCAVETTLKPTRALFEEAAHATGAEVEVRLVPGAWAAFKAGEQDRYLAAIAAAADAAARDGATCVALAQASMAGAVELCRERPPPLSSPAVGLTVAKAAVRSRMQGR